MPLVRVEVRNEYALGAPELWREANKEDPKELLEGVTVAGLVGVLRQLGDLAEFAAQVFHGLQEEVSVTFSRSHKLMARVKRLEVALPPLEKAVLAQRSHLHFAYTAGSNWHTKIRCQQNHFVYSDVPDFIMDSYEDSRDPPRLHLLDRFDPGGPGSCLRRYSDPTYFKRASGAYAEANTGKTAKDKKSRKIKKRSSWSRYGGASCGTSFSYHSGRANLTERSVGEHTSPSQTIFTDEPTLRSDWGEESNLDLRNRTSGYIGGDFCPSYSTQQELESRVSFSSSIKRRDSDFLDYNFIEGKIADACDDNHVNQSLEQAGCGSSSVTGNEKTETPESKMQDCDPYILQENNHDQKSLPQIFEKGAMGNTAVISENADVQHMYVGAASITGNFDRGTRADTVNMETTDVHLEDVESETDDFEDALNNIIESEPETDTEFARKQEVEHYAKLEDKAVHDVGQTELIRHDPESSNSEPNPKANSSLFNGNFDYHNTSVTSLTSVAAHGSIKKTEDSKEVNSVNLVDEALPPAQRDRELSFDSHENNHIDDGPNVESVSPTGSFNFISAMPERPTFDGTRSSPEFLKAIPERPTFDGTRSSPEFLVATPERPITDGIRSSLDIPKPGPETVNVASSTIWTNGGLLGLQPSKPPDLSGSNAHSRDDVNKKDEITRRPRATENHEIEEGGPYMDTRIDQDCQVSVATFRKPTWKLPPADLDVKLVSGASVVAPSSVSANSTFQSVRKNEESCTSSRMLELSNRLLTTGSNKKLLPCENRNANALKNLETDAYQKIFGRTKDLLGVDSMMDSPSSSPPLQHMKILLQPIDGFETSKLKMKFSDGNLNNGSGIDIFPSFQLVPEASITRHDIGSDSDDDTFCRSPSLSDDCESHRSASNSEIWESGESVRSKDHELYDALQRISLTESVSTVPENGNSIHSLQFPVENSINSQSHRSYDIQSLETLNHSFREDLNIYTNLMSVCESQTDPSPAPPPLPPAQWRGADLIEETRVAKHGDRNYTFDEHLESTISQQPKPAPFYHDQVLETTKIQNRKTFSSWKSNGQRQANQGKIIEEKEDFLQQIRTKSFNLRPITSAKMMTPTGGSANVQVTAILEKANAIRQAVGSDDGEDDSNWSDA